MNLERQAKTSVYRPHYHIYPLSGLLNDPNGFSYFNNQWHVFYQSFPFGAVHGLKSWTHLVSNDLVHWHNLGLALLPDSNYDQQGVFSGSAINVNGKLFLMYTGNVRDNNWQRSSYQLGAWMDKDNHITKVTEPLIKNFSNSTGHFRDPQLIKHNSQYYALIGFQNKQTLKGQIGVWQSLDLEHWNYLGPLRINDEILELGYMIECPNLIWIDKQPVLICCPQGLAKSKLNYQNIYPNVYLIGQNFNWQTLNLQSTLNWQNLDEGFDFYASQTLSQSDKQYLISWIGLPETTYPTDNENWANCLSQVKKLSIHNNHLLEQPIPQIKSLRRRAINLENQITIIDEASIINQYELQLSIEADQKSTLYFASNPNNTSCIKLNINTIDGEICLDRSNCSLPFARDYGQTRHVKVAPHQALSLDIYVDHSICEIFVNHGEKVLTARFFMNPHFTCINFTPNKKIRYTGTWWQLAST